METDPVFQRAVETEAELLASVVDLRADLETASLLTALEPEAFLAPYHGAIWRAFREIASNGGVLDAWVTRRHLQRHGAGALELGALERLFDEGHRMPAGELRSRIAAVADSFKRRTLASSLKLLSEKALVSDMSEVESDFAEVASKVAQAGNPHMQPTTDYGTQFEKYLSGEPILPPEMRHNLIATGVEGIDTTIVANPGRLVVVGGLPSAGKTALAIQTAVQTSLAGRRVILGSLEMDADEIAARIVACACGANSLLALRGIQHDVSAGDRAILDRVRQNVIGLHGFSGDSWGSLEAAILREHRRKPISAAIIDYLQLLGEPNTRKRRASETEAQWLGEITKAAKRLAQRLRINVVILSQFNRQVEEGKEPSLQHFLGSGQIERDVDIALLLWNAEKATEVKSSRTVCCRIAKNRGGEMFKKIRLIFNAAQNQFVEELRQTNEIKRSSDWNDLEP